MAAGGAPVRVCTAPEASRHANAGVACSRRPAINFSFASSFDWIAGGMVASGFRPPSPSGLACPEPSTFAFSATWPRS